MYRFQVELSDIDSGVYESLDLRVARHPSEDAERLIVRVLARALAHEEGLEFGRGLSNAEDAALWAHSLTGEVATWVDVGLPGAERLHRASKRAERVIVFTHKPGVTLRKEWRTRKIHQAQTILVHRLAPELVRDLAALLERKMNWFVTIQDRVLSITVGENSFEGPIRVTTLFDLVSASA